MDQPVVGRVEYSPDFHSTPAVKTIPAGVKIVPDKAICYIPLNAVEQTAAKKRVHKALEEFMEQLDELKYLNMVMPAPGPARISYLKNQRHLLLDVFEKKITDIFPTKSEPQ